VSLTPFGPLDVLDVFPLERAALLDLLRSLAPDDQSRPTVCEGWDVKDITSHLLSDDLGRLSGRRDEHRDARPDPDEPLEAFIHRRNGEWVAATRRLSGPVLISLLEVSGCETEAYFRSLDPDGHGVSVSWSGIRPSPNWLDLARELTERWHHQAQIREAVGAPPLDEPAILGPVLDAFAFGLPVTFAATTAPEGTTVTLAVPGPAGGAWTVRRDGDAWTLHRGEPDQPDARVQLPASVVWRMYTRTLPSEAIRQAATIQGQTALAERALSTVSIIA
jgi:uncharacterized protein (TIGR03083 family)